MEGGCHCGAIRFKVSAKPNWVGACYCSDCRKISGAPYVVFAGFKEGEVELLKGSPKKYSSSEKVTRSFCENCNSPFAFIYKEKPNEPFISVGTFDDPSSFAPQVHIFVNSKVPWVSIHDNFPQKP